MKLKETKGITLIALVVTIIVLLILAGISITMLTGQNGILNRAAEAKENTGKAQTEERIKLAYGSALSDGLGVLTYDNLVKELTTEFGAKGTGFTISPEDATATEWKVKVGDASYTISSNGVTKVPDNPPETGAKDKNGVTIASTGETTPFLPNPEKNEIINNDINSGLTIKDENDNEFVWIEVPRTLYDEETRKGVYKNITDLNKTTLEDADYEAIAKDLANYANSTLKSQTTLAGHLPPADKVGTDYTSAYKDMLKSVYQNGGFYIGRYETGIKGTEKSTTSARDYGPDYYTEHPTTDHVAVIKANVQPYTWVSWGQAQTLSQGFATGTSTSSLMMGVQWDLVLKFLKEKEAVTDTQISSSSDWGNYRDASFTLEQGRYAIYNGSLSNTWNLFSFSDDTTTNYVVNKVKQAEKSGVSNSGRVLCTTGANKEKNSKKNIYDLAGNVYEWTIENTSSASYPCALRGGNFGSTGSDIPASYRNGSSTTNSDFSSRFPCLTLLKCRPEP